MVVKQEEAIKEVAAVYKWCQEHRFSSGVAEKLLDIMRGESCDLCEETHMDLILFEKNGYLGFRAQCRDCGTQWVPEKAEEFCGFGFIKEGL